MIRKPLIALCLLIAMATLIWPAELWALGAGVGETVVNTFVVKFVDSATWLGGCL